MSRRSETAIVLAAGANGLGAVRSLQKENVRPEVVAMSKDEPVLYSRYARAKHLVSETGGQFDEKQLLALLLSDKVGKGVLIPTSDEFVSFIFNNSNQLSRKYKLLLPPEDLSTILVDKALETKTISNYLPIPDTVQNLPGTSEELVSLLDLPIIIKPRSHKHMVLGRKNVQLRTAEDVKEFYCEYSENLGDLIAQNIVPGADDTQWVCNCTFGRDSSLIQAFTFQRIRLSPSHYGVTSHAVSKRNAEVISLVEKLGRHLQYSGPAMVEFKYDCRDQKYKYIELNPRIGLCNYFDTTCGINNVYATYMLASGHEPEAAKKQTSGIIFLNLFKDLYCRTKDGERLLHILKDYFSNIGRKHVFIYFAWDDPLPSTVAAKRQGKRLMMAIWNRIRLEYLGGSLSDS